jgi:hypothetical protein
LCHAIYTIGQAKELIAHKKKKEKKGKSPLAYEI